MKLRALLELMRISNLPTVWSNAWMGWMAGSWIFDALPQNDETAYHPFEHPVHLIGIGLLAAAAMSLIYCGGMVFNDYVDREVDAAERPGRPIPSGRIGASSSKRLAIGLLVGGFVMVLVADVLSNASVSLTPSVRTLGLGVGLVTTVVLYNLLHQRWSSAILLMALCRGLLVLVCASLAFAPTDEQAEYENLHTAFWLVVLLFAIPPFCYTVLISAVARHEVDPERGGFGGPKTIMNMIAAMPLLDALWLVLIGLWPASLVCFGCAVLTKLGHRRIAGS